MVGSDGGKEGGGGGGGAGGYPYLRQEVAHWGQKQQPGGQGRPGREGQGTFLQRKTKGCSGEQENSEYNVRI